MHQFATKMVPIPEEKKAFQLLFICLCEIMFIVFVEVELLFLFLV